MDTFVIIAILVAFSRLYLYVHYPTDVLASVVLGLLFAFISCRIIKMIFDKLSKKNESDTVTESK